jgi:hypothetical protein
VGHALLNKRTPSLQQINGCLRHLKFLSQIVVVLLRRFHGLREMFKLRLVVITPLEEPFCDASISRGVAGAVFHGIFLVWVVENAIVGFVASKNCTEAHGHVLARVSGDLLPLKLTR